MQLNMMVTVAVAVLVILVLFYLVIRLRKTNQQCENNLTNISQEKADLNQRLGSLAGIEAEAARLRSSLEAEKKAASIEVERLKFEAEKLDRERADLNQRLAPILDIEAEAARLRSSLEAEKQAASIEVERLKFEADRLRERYAQALKTFETLQAEVAKLEENLEDVSYGLYRPHFTFESTIEYKAAVQSVRDHQKELVKAGKAVHCSVKWSVGDSATEGDKMTKQHEKLILRAFNAESEAAIANVTWSNYRIMRERIEKACEALNKLGRVLQVSILPEYRDARLRELQWVFEAAEKRQQEEEERRRIRAEQREEERVQRELLKEKEDAEKEEANFEKTIEKVRREMEAAAGAERDAMQAKIQQLQDDLAKARERKERAISRAQQTKAGDVYIISNIGSFGEGVLKIGLTRREHPDERIQELGDASVPFPFDKHALIHSDNAPELEQILHDHFSDRRLNLVNHRKEFFRVSLDEVKAQLSALGIKADITSIPEAKEYRETRAALSNKEYKPKSNEVAQAQAPFPKDPFESPEEQKQS